MDTLYPMFAGDLFFLSNMFPANFTFNGILYKSSEHFYQSKKCVFDSDERWIINEPSPYRAKTKARKVFVRSNWNDIKDAVMIHAVLEKFRQNPDITHLLMNYNEAIIEWNDWHDNYWGSCMCDNCKDIKGKNKLGNIISQVKNFYL